MTVLPYKPKGYIMPDNATYTMGFSGFRPVKNTWPKTIMDVDVILNHLTENGKPVDVVYGSVLRHLLDSCTWKEVKSGEVALVEFNDKKKMLNVFMNTFETVEETIFWLKFADHKAVDERMEKCRLMVTLDDKRNT